MVTTAILAVLLLLPIGSLVTNWLVRRKGWEWFAQHGLPISAGVLWAWEIARWLVAVLLMLGMVSLIYRFGPRVKRRFRLVSPGSLFTVVSWSALGLAFRIYVEHFGNYSATYGAVGGVVILLLVLYLDGLLLLIGAEIDSVIEKGAGEGPPGERDRPEAPTPEL